MESRQQLKKTELQKHVCKADQLQNEMDWDSKALKAWEETLKKRDEDNDLIQKLSKEDEMRFNTLEAKRQHLQGVLTDSRAKGAKVYSNAYNCERMLERSGERCKSFFIYWGHYFKITVLLYAANAIVKYFQNLFRNIFVTLLCGD